MNSRMGHSPIRQSFEFGKSISTAGKSILISYNCQVWLQNIVKCEKYGPVKFANFVYFCTTRGKALPLCGNVVTLFTLLYFRHFTIFYKQTLQFHKIKKLFPIVLKLFSNLKVCLIGEWSIQTYIIIFVLFNFFDFCGDRCLKLTRQTFVC